MADVERLSVWQNWMRRPQKMWLRRALFQVHLWSGIILGLYVLMISLTGSVLVYRNELYRAATPPEGIIPNAPPPLGIRLVSGLLDLHDNLFAGPEGRRVNGLGALALLLVVITGMVVWWPGAKTWRRSLKVPRGVGWKRTIWHLHSMLGFWTIAFVLIFCISGVYLAFPDPFMNAADWLQPPTTNSGLRTVDWIIYWLAYLHFGRIQGIGIPCKGPGLCDQSVKALWAFFGLAPAAMFLTGAIMWWNRVLRPRMRPARVEETKASPAGLVES